MHRRYCPKEDSIQHILAYFLLVEIIIMLSRDLKSLTITDDDSLCMKQIYFFKQYYPIHILLIMQVAIFMTSKCTLFNYTKIKRNLRARRITDLDEDL